MQTLSTLDQKTRLGCFDSLSGLLMFWVVFEKPTPLLKINLESMVIDPLGPWSSKDFVHS